MGVLSYDTVSKCREDTNCGALVPTDEHDVGMRRGITGVSGAGFCLVCVKSRESTIRTMILHGLQLSCLMKVACFDKTPRTTLSHVTLSASD